MSATCFVGLNAGVGDETSLISLWREASYRMCWRQNTTQEF